MSVTYRCDHCDAEIPPEDLRLRKAIQVKDRVFCARCKGPVVALLRKKAAARSAPGKPARTASPESGGAATPEGRTRSAPDTPASPPARGGAGGRARPRAAGSGPPSRTPVERKKSPGRPAGVSPGSPKRGAPRAGAPRRPGAATGRTRPSSTSRVAKTGSARGRKPVGSGTGSPRLAGRRRLARPATGDGGRRRPGPLILLLGAAGAIVVLGVVGFILSRGGAPGPAPVELASGGTPSAETRVDRVEDAPAAASTEETSRQRKRLIALQDRLRQGLGASREKKQFVLEELEYAARLELRSGGLDERMREEFRKLARGVQSEKEKLAEEVLTETLEKSRKLQETGDYILAYELWKVTPSIVAYSPGVNPRWAQEAQQARRYAEAGRYWSMIVEKVRRYLAQKDEKIALAILEKNITRETYERDFPLIWKERQSIIEDVQRAKGTVVAELVAKEVELRRQELLARREQRRREREEKWTFALDALDWTPLLSVGGDLENWHKVPLDRSRLEAEGNFPWQNLTLGGEQVLSADTTELKRGIFIAQAGTRWQDWALKFEVRVPKGKLSLQTRTIYDSRYSEMPSRSATETLVFDAGEYGDWTSILVYVHANEIRWLQGEEGSATEKGTFRCDHERGGFAFLLDPGSQCEIRRVALKLVNEIERGEQAEESEFGLDEPEEDDEDL